MRSPRRGTRAVAPVTSTRTSNSLTILESVLSLLQIKDLSQSNHHIEAVHIAEVFHGVRNFCNLSSAKFGCVRSKCGCMRERNASLPVQAKLPEDPTTLRGAAGFRWPSPISAPKRFASNAMFSDIFLCRGLRLAASY